jgi:hypothetical protein
MILGQNKWDEIFRAGNHTDSQGRVKSWSEADLDHLVTSYDPSKHEAPIVVGHPKDNAPAFGWVKALKREGKALLAQYGQVAPEFAEAVQAGRYKKRSISIYPDGTIRHVGWLGAQPPAIKGLPDFAFADGGDPLTYEEFTQEGKMTLEEMQAKLDEETKARVEAEGKAATLATQNGELQAKVQASEASFAESEKKRKRTEIETVIDSGIQAGKILPAWKKAGLVEFMAGLDETPTEYEFSEGKKQTPAGWFKDFLSSFSEHPLFSKMSKDHAENQGQKTGETEDQKAVALLLKNAK